MESTLKRLRSDLDAALRGDRQDYADWLVQLLVIKSAGYMEQTVLLSARSHISARGIGSVRNYGLARVENYFGPKPDQLETFVGRFSSEWATELRELLDEDDEELRREVRALLSARDQIAHGKSHSVGSVKALGFCSAAEKVSAWFQLRLNPL